MMMTARLTKSLPTLLATLVHLSSACSAAQTPPAPTECGPEVVYRFELLNYYKRRPPASLSFHPPLRSFVIVCVIVLGMDKA